MAPPAFRFEDGHAYNFITAGDEDYIGVMQTVARCLYEGRMSDLTSLVDWLDKHGSCG